jgi:hypothetical protein
MSTFGTDIRLLSSRTSGAGRVKTPKRNGAGKDFSEIPGILSDLSPNNFEMSSRARRISSEN